MHDTTRRQRRLAHLEEAWATQRAERSASIDRLIEEASDRGDCADRMYWTLLYDFEHAPITTNLRQLEETGFAPPAEVGLADAELGTWLWELIETLAELGVYLVHTDHLGDRELYRRLVDEVLIEPVRALPPGAGVSEFIDLVGGDDDAQRVIYQRYFASEAERVSWRERRGERIAACVPPHDRDRFLPRPDCHERDDEPGGDDAAKMEDGRLPLK